MGSYPTLLNLLTVVFKIPAPALKVATGSENGFEVAHVTLQQQRLEQCRSGQTALYIVHVLETLNATY